MQGLYRENPSIVLRDIKGDLKKKQFLFGSIQCYKIINFS